MKKKLSNLLKYGIRQELATDLILKGLSITTLKNTSVKNLVGKYNIEKSLADEIKHLVKRSPIDNEILNKLLLNNNFTCCCCLGGKGQTIIIHHIVEYEKTQDNSYDNLAVLCPTCHDLVHSKRALTLSISLDQLRTAKESWEKNCIDKRNGLSRLEPLEPLGESWIGEFQIQDEYSALEYRFNLVLFKSEDEIYGSFYITYLNRGNVFMVGEFKHKNNEEVDVDIDIIHWGINWGRRITEKSISKAIISYGFEDVIYITNLDSENDIFPYQLKLDKDVIE